MRTRTVVAQAVAAVLVVAAAVPAAAGRPVPAAVTAARAPAAELLPSQRASGVVQDGSVTVDRERWRPRDLLAGVGERDDRVARSRAVRSALEALWATRIPDARATTAESDGDDQTFRWVLPANGDFDGDGLADAFSYEVTLPDASFALRALRGLDGTELWRVEREHAFDVVPLFPGDVSGDGRADLLLVELAYDDGFDGSCVVVVCSWSDDTTWVWTIRAASGTDGADLWSRSYEGGVVEDGSSTVATSAYEYTITNALAIVAPTADVDGDGADDVAIETVDVERSASTTDALVVWTVQRSQYSVTRLGVVGGSDGEVVFHRTGPRIAGLDIYVPWGDLSGGAEGDYVLLGSRAEPGSYTCVSFVGCNDSSEWSEVVGVLDGGTSEIAWSTDLGTSGFAFPLEGDVTGDGKVDLVHLDFGDAVVDLLHGTTGAVAWTRDFDPFLFFVPLGSVDGGPGSDLLAVSVAFSDGETCIGLGRVDGTSGDDLFATEHCFASEPDHALWFAAFPVGDVDGDGVLDVIVQASPYDFDEQRFVRSTMAVESAVDGDVLLSKDEDADLLWVPAGLWAGAPGDLDGDGLDDLLEVTVALTPDHAVFGWSALVASTGDLSWTRTDRFPNHGAAYSDFDLHASDDLDGDGTHDYLYSRLLLEWDDDVERSVSRVDAVSGADGTPRWGAGPAWPY